MKAESEKRKPESQALASESANTAASPVSGLRSPVSIKVTKTSTWSELVKTELDLLYRTAVVTEPLRFEPVAARARLGREKYLALGSRLGGIPWWFLACVHNMECGMNWERHWHNGDPLTARTVNVPAGRPKRGEPPFSWLASAEDALRMKKLDEVLDWSMPHALWLLEKYNGHGYRLYRGIHSPYLWAGTNHYKAGKYTSDGKYDAAAVSKQAGCAGLIKILTGGVK
jgi:lysozyme family protein